MKTIIAGSRSYHNREFLDDAIAKARLDITEVVCGCAPGVDSMGRDWANEQGVPVVEFPADWKLHGKAAGPIRNEQMAKYADTLILVWDGKSPGSRSMLGLAKRYGLEVHQFVF